MGATIPKMGITVKYFYTRFVLIEFIPILGGFIMLSIPLLSNSQNGINRICSCIMRTQDFDERVRHNLRRLIDKYDGGNQSAFARRFDIKPSFINGVLNKKRAIGKGIIESICNKLDVDISELTLPENPTWPASVHEERAVYQAREAEKLGVITQVEAVTQAIISEGKKKEVADRAGKTVGVPRRARKRAG